MRNHVEAAAENVARLPEAQYERMMIEHGIDERISVENLVFGTSVFGSSNEGKRQNKALTS